MTFSDQPPPDPFLPDISYATVTGSREGTLVRLAVIFNYIIAGADVLAALLQLAMMGLMYFVIQKGGMGPPPPGPAPGLPPTFVILIYPVYALFALSAATVNFLSAQALRKRKPTAFGWTLASGIVNCFALLWCSLGCVLPLAAGIYSIVIMCLEPVRMHLQNGPQEVVS
jgi:hypothetical protein